MRLTDEEIEILVHASQAFYEQHRDDNSKIHFHVSPREAQNFASQCAPFAIQVLELFRDAEKRNCTIEKMRQEAQQFFAEQLESN